MSTIPPIQVKVEADTTGLKQGLQQAETGIKNMNDSVKTANTGMSNFTANLKKVAGALGVAFAGAQVAKFAKDSVMAASDMAESVSKVNVVFGDTAKEVLDFGQTAATSMGISKQKALEAAGTYGNLFQALGVTKDKSQEMSVSMVQLAADLGSFNNMSVDDSLNALRSGLSGETEPLKRFGVSLNDTILKAKALEMGFGKITGVMDPAIKSQVIYATVLEQTKKAQGDYARTADGTANTMKTLQAKFEDAKVAVGDALMPAFKGLLAVLSLAIPVLESIGKFFQENQAEVKAFAITVGILGAAWGAYTVYVKAAIIQQKILNLVQKMNPIGLIVIAVGLLVGAMVKLFNSNETFRKAVISVAKVALNAFASIIPMVAQVIEAILKITTGPLRLLLGALSKLPGVGKYAKAGLDIMNKGLDGISDLGTKAAAKATELSNKLDKMGTIAEKAGKKTKDATKDIIGDTGAGGGGKGGGKVDTKTAEKLAKYKTDVQKIYKDMNEVIADANADAVKAAVERDEKILEANTRFNETIADATKRSKEADAEANKRYDEQILDIKKDYAKRTLDLEKDLNKKIADLKASAAQKSLDLTKQAAEKQDGILKQSMDRLRSAFASKTGFSLQDSFASGKSTDSLLKDLKTKLEAAKELQANAAMLAGMGYSQVFIEEVVKNGPEAGNEIAKALKSASPEATKELQTLYAQVDTISNHGLDELAATMNAGGKLATDELRTAYSQVAIDLKTSLKEVDSQLQQSLADANAAYMEAMTEAKTNRDERIAEADAQLIEALAKSKKALDDATAEAQATLTKTLAEVQKNYEKQIDEINAATQKKLQELKDKLKEVAAAMAALGAAQAAAAAMASAPVYTPITGGTTASGTPFGQAGSTTVTNVNNTFNSMGTPSAYDIQSGVIAGVKYGNAVVNTTTLAGITAASATKPKAMSGADAVAAARQRNGGYL